MLYSSGTTGRPKGIVRPLAEQPPSQLLPIFSFLLKLWQYREGMIYLSPAPLYHSAPQAAVNLTIRMGGTAIIMERFDPEHYLQLIEKYRVTPQPAGADHVLAHAEAAGGDARRGTTSSFAGDRHPCGGALPGPGQGTDDRLVGPDHPRVLRRHRGAGLHRLQLARSGWRTRARSGRVLLGELHVLDDDMKPLPTGTPGTLWFKTATPFEYFNDPGKTREARSEPTAR